VETHSALNRDKTQLLGNGRKKAVQHLKEGGEGLLVLQKWGRFTIR